MRMRITNSELEYFAKAKRDGSTVRVQGWNWRVIGISADRVPNAMASPAPGAAQGEQQQMWVDLTEA